VADVAYRAEVVGSLLRPSALVEARRAMWAGELSAEEFRLAEDGAVDGALRLQEEAGVDVVTDGEMRRDVFFDFFVSGLDGLSMLRVTRSGSGAGRARTPCG
jgi:5-methyltetrahydropteroyltriglutamate--homocysteine methyltransferase